MKIKYTGLRRKGTMTPRRIWIPGETLEVPDSIAEELILDPEFSQVKPRKRRKK